VRFRRSRLQRGSVTVLTAGTLFLAGILALVAVDLMRTVQAQAIAQAAADAAALAAAQELAIPSGAATPAEVATEYADLNGATLRSCDCDPGSTEAVVQVEVPVRLVFVGPDRSTTAWARAVVGSGS
jgi:secretion/DNA translocation related TadE-like protein